MRRFEGYMTVEASFIVPMVIGVFAFIIYLTNYAYARCILAQDTYLLAFRASCQEAQEPREYVHEKSCHVAGKKYFGSSYPQFEVRVNGKIIEVTDQTTTKHAVLKGLFKNINGAWGVHQVQTARKRDYAGHVRKVKRIKDIGVKE